MCVGVCKSIFLHRSLNIVCIFVLQIDGFTDFADLVNFGKLKSVCFSLAV